MTTFEMFKAGCELYAVQNTLGVAKPTEKVQPDLAANAAAISKWEADKQILVDGIEANPDAVPPIVAVPPITEAAAIAKLGAKPEDLSDQAKWPSKEIDHECIAAFKTGGGNLWQDPKTTLYILAEEAAGLSDYVKQKAAEDDKVLKDKLNEIIAVINLLMFKSMPPMITVPQTTIITEPIKPLT